MSFDTIKREKLFKNPGKEFQYPELQKLTLPHIQSFNNIFECDRRGDSSGLLALSVKNLPKRVLFDHVGSANNGLGDKIAFWLEDPVVHKPMLPVKERFSIDRNIYPSECRERKSAYAGNFTIKVCWSINDGPVEYEERNLGQLPIMVRSKLCNLYGMGPRELIRHHEETEEMGGYFVINGNEKIIRLLIAPRRNYVTAITRPSFANRGTIYSNHGAVIRCVRNDETSQTITVHYLNDGNCIFKFYHNKQEYLIPVMLIFKALLNVCDKDIFDAIVRGDTENTFILDRVEILLRSFKTLGLDSKHQCLEHLGAKFKVVMGCPEDYTDRQVGEYLLDNFVLVHLDDNKSKFELLAFMIRKLYALAAGEISPDNPDSPQFHEVLLGGHLYCNIIKERLDGILEGLKVQLTRNLRTSKERLGLLGKPFVLKALEKCSCDVGQKLYYFLATGNLISRSGLDQMQVSGYTITAEKLNFLRYISHFQCIHRGAFFAELKTTSVRKLLPEAWGFLCPVHTPDGSPCGLLNHLAHRCHIVTRFADVSGLPRLLYSLGVSPLSGFYSGDKDSVTVQLDGRILGCCSPGEAAQMAKQLRKLKVEGHGDVPLDLEIGHVPVSNGGLFPGLFLFSAPSRMTRPVKYLASGAEDSVGPFEQVYMEIACLKEDIVPGITTHLEYAPTNILSVVANLTPFSDFNQSPRNMYQCQMGKQTMGTPTQTLRYRTDNKLYRLQTGQTPIVRPRLHNTYGMDGFPNGTNAIVAVISYTGYDMEDAMILNKSAYERGFAYGTVYKTEVVDLDMRGKGRQTRHFGFGPNYRPREEILDFLDGDGLPFVGLKLTAGNPMYATHDSVSDRTRIMRYKSSEDGIVDDVILTGGDLGQSECTKLLIRFRVVRPPVIGDKFSSRHGQKGVCSQKWPAVDMPFSESGILPDVIINPHAFPSRMTIGMFIESLAGKAGALHGVAQDSTPFTFTESYSAADHFGEQLRKAGYSYYGNEPMYSGITGEEFKVDIYIGVVFYQRLRHMVSDKYQVRTTGPVHTLTQQPIKGRKRAGGIRFGEMERDSLLAHGVSFLLQDRLMNCSDYSQVYVCRRCGSFLSTISVAPTTAHGQRHMHCRSCDSSAGIDLIAVPYVFRYLATELTAMNIKLKLTVTE